MAKPDDATALMDSAWATRRQSFSASGSEREALTNEAHQKLTDAVAICRKAGELPALAQAIHLLANVEHEMGRDDVAETLWDEAVSVCRAVGEPFQLAHKVRHLGDLNKHLGRLEQAETCYKEAVNLYRSHDDPPKLDFANAAGHYALLKESMKAPQEALRLWREARDLYDGVDVNLFTHVGSNFGMSWGQGGGNALWSVQFRFTGETAHSAGSPWRGRSALDAIMLMAQAWEYKREHLQPAARSHYIIVEGGDQPNVVPQTATIWFYFRERDYDGTKAMYDAAVKMAEGAALMTNTEIDTIMTVGSAWGRHFSKPVAEATYANIQEVGLPEWDENDQALALGLQSELGVDENGLPDSIPELRGPVDLSRSLGGGSDDIGDVSWNMPTVTLRYPSNIPGGPGHNWANGIAMATPIAHKGAVAGAKVQARTLLDLFLNPQIVADAHTYFNDVQTAETTYTPFIAPTDEPAIWLNEDIMARWRPVMREFYYDPDRFENYLEQLGIEYPTVRTRAVSQDGS